MNVKNNKRRRSSQEKIEKAFIELLQTQEIKEIMSKPQPEMYTRMMNEEINV